MRAYFYADDGRYIGDRDLYDGESLPSNATLIPCIVGDNQEAYYSGGEWVSNVLTGGNGLISKYSGAVLTIIEDDGYQYWYDNYKSIYDSFGVKCTHGIVEDWVGTSGYMTETELIELHSLGYEMMCHSKVHDKVTYPSAGVTLDTTQAEYEEDMTSCAGYLMNLGFREANNMVYPYGNYNTTMKAIIRSASVNIFRGGALDGNTSGDYLMLRRETFLTSDTAQTTIIKSLIDGIIASDGWLILGQHATASQSSSVELAAILQYCADNGVVVMTFNDALRNKGE